jgi:hypothetical protein
MRKYIIGAALAASVLMSASANAAVVVSSVGGSTLSPNFQGGPSGATYITFEDVVVGTSGSFVSNGFSFSAVTGGGGAVKHVPDVSGSYASPAGDTTNYLTTGFNGASGTVAEQLALGGSFTKFGLYWGSIDQYNTITFLKNGVALADGVFTGSDVPSVANGNQTSDTTNRYVNFAFAGEFFDAVRFTSTSPAFEVDNLAIAGAVPEASTWAMMVLGFLGLGFLGYRKSSRTSGVAFRMA